MQSATTAAYLPTVPEQGWRMFDFFSTPAKPYIKSCTLATIRAKDIDGKTKKYVFTIARASAWGDRTVRLYGRGTLQNGYTFSIGADSLGYMFDPMTNVLKFQADWEKRPDCISFTWGRHIQTIIHIAGLI